MPFSVVTIFTIAFATFHIVSSAVLFYVVYVGELSSVVPYDVIKSLVVKVLRHHCLFYEPFVALNFALHYEFFFNDLIYRVY